jgi:hypothetical protein
MDMNHLPFESVENEFLRVDYLTSLGPRIIGLYAKQGDVQLFAKTPDAHWPTPHGEYYLHGGHRLWISPEDPFYTCPEDNVEIVVEGQSVTLHSTVEPSGLEKEISFSLQENHVALTHRVTSHASEPIELAPWAITQMQLGGMAILPQSVLNTGLLPNRNHVLWSYSRLEDQRLELHDDFILVHGQAAQYPFKIGNYNPYGWCAYVRGKALFVKRFAVNPVRTQPDVGCNVETYVHDTFLELETLGALTTLQPKDSVTYQEEWEVISGEYSATLETARRISTQLSPKQNEWSK